MYRTKDDRSLGDLFSELSREISTLIRQEIRLARTELSDKVGLLGRDAASVAIGGAVLYAGLLVFLFALVLILNLAIHMLWLSSLIVAVVVLAIGYGFVQRGLNNLKHEDVTPHQTIDSLRDDIDWAKEKTR